MSTGVPVLTDWWNGDFVRNATVQGVKSPLQSVHDKTRHLYYPESLGVYISFQGNVLPFPTNTCTERWNIVRLCGVCGLFRWSCVLSSVSHASHQCSQAQEMPRTARPGPAWFSVAGASPLLAVFCRVQGNSSTGPTPGFKPTASTGF